MANKTTIIQGTISDLDSGTIDFTETDFGTVDAYRVIVTPDNLGLSIGGTNATAPVDASMSIGISDGTRSRVVTFFDEDNQSTSDGYRWGQTGGNVILLLDGTGGSATEYSHNSVIADGVRFNVDSVPTTGYPVTIQLFQCDNAEVGDFITTGGDYYAPLSFEARAVYAMSSLATMGQASPTNEARIAYGWSANKDIAARFCTCYGSVDDASTTDAYDIHSTSSLIEDVDFEVSLGSTTISEYSNTGLIFNDLALSVEGSFLALDFGGLDVFVGVTGTAISAGSQSFTSIGFRPQYIEAFATRQDAALWGPARTNNNAGTHAIGMSVGTGSTQQKSHHVRTYDGVTTSETHNDQTDNFVYMPHNFGGVDSDNLMHCNLESFDTDGFTLDWLATTTTERQWGFFALQAEGTIYPVGIESVESFGSIQDIVGGYRIIEPSAISSVASVGSPNILSLLQVIGPAGISSQEDFPSPPLTVWGGIPSEETIGWHVITGGVPVTISPGGEGGVGDPTEWSDWTMWWRSSMFFSQGNNTSSLLQSRWHDDVIFTNPDSSTIDVIWAIAMTGTYAPSDERIRDTFGFSGDTVGNLDWEDLSYGPGPNGDDYLYLSNGGDHGNNTGASIYRVPAPTGALSNPGWPNSPNPDTLLTGWERMHFERNGLNFEAMVVDPVGTGIYLFHKGGASSGDVYMLTGTTDKWVDNPVTDTHDLRTVQSNWAIPGCSSADVSQNGRVIVTSSTGSIGYCYVRPEGTDFEYFFTGSSVTRFEVTGFNNYCGAVDNRWEGICFSTGEDRILHIKEGSPTASFPNCDDGVLEVAYQTGSFEQAGTESGGIASEESFGILTVTNNAATGQSVTLSAGIASVESFGSHTLSQEGVSYDSPYGTSGNTRYFPRRYYGEEILGLTSISPEIYLSRDTGLTPAFIHFSASPTIAAGMSTGQFYTAWSRLEYTWDFGETGTAETVINPWVENTSPINGSNIEVQDPDNPWDGQATIDMNTGQIGPETMYVYRTPGNYTVTLTARGWDGTWDSNDQPVYITETYETGISIGEWTGATGWLDFSDAGSSDLGTEAEPWTGWTDATQWVEGGDYRKLLIKRGTTGIVTRNHNPAGTTGCRIDAYGAGERPVLEIDVSVHGAGGGDYIIVYDGDSIYDYVTSNLIMRQTGTTAEWGNDLKAIRWDGFSENYVVRNVYHENLSLENCCIGDIGSRSEIQNRGYYKVDVSVAPGYHGVKDGVKIQGSSFLHTSRGDSVTDMRNDDRDFSFYVGSYLRTPNMDDGDVALRHLIYWADCSHVYGAFNRYMGGTGLNNAVNGNVGEQTEPIELDDGMIGTYWYQCGNSIYNCNQIFDASDNGSDSAGYIGQALYQFNATMNLQTTIGGRLIYSAEGVPSSLTGQNLTVRDSVHFGPMSPDQDGVSSLGSPAGAWIGGGDYINEEGSWHWIRNKAHYTGSTITDDDMSSHMLGSVYTDVKTYIYDSSFFDLRNDAELTTLHWGDHHPVTGTARCLIDYNHWHSPNNTTVFDDIRGGEPDKDFDAWTGNGWDANGLTGDHLWEDPGNGDFRVTGRANYLVYDTAPPSVVTTGDTWSSFVVECMDDFGTRSTGFTSNVILTPVSGPTLGGTTTVAAVAGVATFDDVNADTTGDTVFFARVESPSNVIITEDTTVELQGEGAVAPSGIASVASIGSPTIEQSIQSVIIAGILSVESVSSPTITPSAQTIAPLQNTNWLHFPADYYGDEIPGLTSITPVITIDRSSGNTPCFVYVSAKSTTMSATDATRPYEQLEYTWDFGDGSGTETLLAPAGPEAGETVNLNTSQHGPEATYCYRTADTFTITLTVRGWDGSTYVQNTTTQNVTTTDYASYTEYFFDPTSGSDSNDGRDHLGFNLSSATYDDLGNGEGDYHLSSTSAFSSYTWASGDKIYLDAGAGITPGLYEVASKVDSDAILLISSAGSDSTGDVGSSDGAKQTYSAMTALVGSNTRILIKSGETMLTAGGSNIAVANDTNFRMGTYGGTARATVQISGSEPTGQMLLIQVNTASQTNSDIVFSNIEFDAVSATGLSYVVRIRGALAVTSEYIYLDNCKVTYAGTATTYMVNVQMSNDESVAQSIGGWMTDVDAGLANQINIWVNMGSHTTGGGDYFSWVGGHNQGGDGDAGTGPGTHPFYIIDHTHCLMRYCKTGPHVKHSTCFKMVCYPQAALIQDYWLVSDCYVSGTERLGIAMSGNGADGQMRHAIAQRNHVTAFDNDGGADPLLGTALYCSNGFEDMVIFRDNDLWEVGGINPANPGLFFSATAVSADYEPQLYRNRFYDSETTNDKNWIRTELSAGNVYIVDNHTHQEGNTLYVGVPFSDPGTINYNRWYTPNDSTPFEDEDTSTAKTFAQWQANGWDLNGVDADPGWTSPAAGDFSSQNGIQSVEAFGTPTVELLVEGALTISGITSVETIGTHSVSQSISSITVTGISTVESIGTHGVDLQTTPPASITIIRPAID